MFSKKRGKNEVQIKCNLCKHHIELRNKTWQSKLDANWHRKMSSTCTWTIKSLNVVLIAVFRWTQDRKKSCSFCSNTTGHWNATEWIHHWTNEKKKVEVYIIISIAAKLTARSKIALEKMEHSWLKTIRRRVNGNERVSESVKASKKWIYYHWFEQKSVLRVQFNWNLFRFIVGINLRVFCEKLNALILW